MNKMIIINLVFIAYCIGLVVTISSINTELKSAVEDRAPGYTTIEVKPVRNYEDRLQMSADNRVIKLQFASAGL